MYLLKEWFWLILLCYLEKETFFGFAIFAILFWHPQLLRQ